ncbi:putative Zn-dependent peptidase [Roseinatronobacter thiooxidans]|uniref:Putative Zn-dependent peptidase n=1 Tax=Roseinatronobacter thiooxidans TaxID=121821 RepID=A0A2W7QFA1_9RHOB|nr:insulinase family protein [Roseinatronobacter thiooxidans]PZX44510.1 putative Zn-dependent peptidase [Roseinatronobacter thiooxidans]
MTRFRTWLTVGAIGFTGLALLAYQTSVSINAIAFHITPTDTTGRAEVILRIARPFDPDEQVGLAHYAEHLAWYSAIGEDARGPDRHSGAWTSHRAVFYSLSGKPEDLPQLTATLARVFDPITLEARFAEEEREIIQREYQAMFANDISRRADEALSAVLHEGTLLASSVIGTPAQIHALDYDAARVWHRATHRPENAVFIFRGDVGRLQIWRALIGLRLERGHSDPVTFHYQMGPEITHLVDFPDDSAAPRMIWRRVVVLDAPIQFDLLEARLDHLRAMLDTNLPGGLAGPLRFDARIAREFRIDLYPIDAQHIELRFHASPDTGTSLPELRAAFEATLADIAASGIPAPTYQRVMARMDRYWPDWGDHDKTRRWMADYTTDRVLALREPQSKRVLQEIPPQITRESLNTLLAALPQSGRTAIAFIAPQEFLE